MSAFSSSAAVSGSEPSMMTSDANFDSFIDSDLILDVNSPTASPVTPNASSKKEHKAKPSNLSALPSRLAPHTMDRHSPSSPGAAMHDFLQYPHSSPSTVTTPTTSNSSSLHNLSFDFLDGGEGGADGAGSTGNDPSDAMSPDADMTNMSTPSAATFSASTPSATAAESSINGFGSVVPMAGLQQSCQRTVDDMGHQPGHQQAAHHHAHHQRSLSLRDLNETSHLVGGGMQTFPMMPHNAAFTSFNFDNVNAKMEMEMMHQGGFGGMLPFQGRGLGDGQNGGPTPPKVKKRRLTSGSKGADGKKDPKAAATKKSGNANRRSRAATTPANKDAKTGGATGSGEAGGSAVPAEGQDLASMLVTSLIENIPSGAGDASGTMTFAMPMVDRIKEEHPADESMGSLLAPSSRAASEETEGSGDEDLERKPKGKGNKRPPPSASQITESGMPFPVIDTSAKHSSLFVPPDTSGLTKREARLVKNRAAAFLSRQRKREQFEELDIKCRALCRLVWTMWELGTGKGVTGGASKVSALFTNQSRMSDIILQEEGAEVQEVFDTVLTLKGGSVAPTEDGQLQGAVEAGIMSANGKIMGDASSVVHVPSKAARAAEEAAKELAKLRSELGESKAREVALQAEVAHERAARLKIEFEAQQRMQEQQPFRGGSKHDLSLTEPATFEEDDEDAAEEDESRCDAGNTSANGQKKGRAARPARASQRLQRQGQPGSATASAAVSAPAGGQRKAAGAALMMVLFSFALFGLPGGQTGRVGGVTRVPGSSDEFPLGRVLGAPMGASSYVGGEDEDEAMEADVSSHLPPSSHLSVNDLFPPAHEMQDLLNAAAAAGGVGVREDDASGGKNRLPHSLRDVFGGSRTSDSAGDFSVDYKAFAKDLGASLDWDMQGGFLVLGGDGDEESSASTASGLGKGAKDDKYTHVDDADQQDKSSSELKDAPTKLTLFVPAPDMSNSPESDSVEDFFYDAPLAGADAQSNNPALGEEGRTAGDRTQAEATRAALQVLRNHRVAREAAAFAASRRFSKQPSPSQRVRSPTLSLVSLSSKNQDGAESASGKHDVGKDAEDAGEDGDDFSNEVMDASRSTADRIRGTDFYQLEFSLSRAKVRNVAELARLFGSMRSTSE